MADSKSTTSPTHNLNKLNQNPLIEPDSAVDTLNNVAAVLAFIQELALHRNPKVDLMLAEPSGTGLYFIFSCLRSALEYEINRHTENTA